MDQETFTPQQPEVQQPAPFAQPQPTYQQPAPPVQPFPAYQQQGAPGYGQPAYQQPVQPQPVYQQPIPPVQPQPVYPHPAQTGYTQPVYTQPVQPGYAQPGYAQPVYTQSVQPGYVQPVYYQTAQPQQTEFEKEAPNLIPNRRFPLISVICLSVTIAYALYALLAPLFTKGSLGGSLFAFLPPALMLLGACLCKVRRNTLFALGLLAMGALRLSNAPELSVTDWKLLLAWLSSGGIGSSFLALAVCYFIGSPKVRVLKLCFAIASAALCAISLLYTVLTHLYMPSQYFLDLGLGYGLGMLPIYIAVFFYTPFKK